MADRDLLDEGRQLVAARKGGGGSSLHQPPTGASRPETLQVLVGGLEPAESLVCAALAGVEPELL